MLVVFWCALQFFTIWKKFIKANFIKFCVKNLIKCARKFEMMTVTFGLLLAEYKFNYGITGLRKAKKMSMMMLILVV